MNLLPLVAAALVLVAIGGKRRPSSGPLEQRACPPSGTRVLFIGDSNGVGLAGAFYEGVALPRPLLKLAQACGAPMTIDVLGGQGATYFAPRIETLLDTAEPTLLLVNLGANDYTRNDPEHVAASILKIVTAAKSRNVQVIWISPPKFGPPLEVDKIGALGMWRATGVTEFQTPILPDRSDRIHYTDAGYRELAALIWAFVSSEAR